MATAGLNAAVRRPPVRAVFWKQRNVTFRNATVVGVDWDARSSSSTSAAGGLRRADPRRGGGNQLVRRARGLGARLPAVLPGRRPAPPQPPAVPGRAGGREAHRRRGSSDLVLVGGGPTGWRPPAHWPSWSTTCSPRTSRARLRPPAPDRAGRVGDTLLGPFAPSCSPTPRRPWRSEASRCCWATRSIVGRTRSAWSGRRILTSHGGLGGRGAGQRFGRRARAGAGPRRAHRGRRDPRRPRSPQRLRGGGRGRDLGARRAAASRRGSGGHPVGAPRRPPGGSDVRPSRRPEPLPLQGQGDHGHDRATGGCGSAALGAEAKGTLGWWSCPASTSST